MKNLKLWFNDFWPSFDKTDNLFIYALSQKYNLILTSDNPDLVITDDYRYRYQNAKMVYFSGEPFFEIGNCDYALTSFNVDDDRFFRVPLYLLYAYDYYRHGITSSYDAVLKDRQYYDLKNKNNFCAYITRGGNHRGNFFLKLNEYKFVNSLGPHYNNTSPIAGEPGTIFGSIEKYKTLQNYKFCISFENTDNYNNNIGYTTEKIYEPLMSSCIPIYWGNEKISDDFNDKSFINWKNYGSDEKTIEKIIEVDNDDNLYMDYITQPIVNLKNNQMFKIDYLVHIFEEIING